MSAAAGVLLIASTGLMAAGPATAADVYPSKTIRLVVPFAPGGGSDIVARLLSPKMTEALGQTVVVDNRAGASANLGAAMVAKAAPDGYTLLAGNPGPLTVAPAISLNVPYDTLRDFTPVTLVAKSPSVLIVHPALPAKNVREFVALAKARPGKLNYGTPGVGTVGHLSTEAFAHLAGINVIHVPYKGGVSQYTIELISGYIDFASLQLFNVAPMVKQGKLRALGITSRERSAAMPELATFNEQGVKFENYNWNGVLLPAKTPPAIVARIYGVLATAIKENRELFTGQGQEPGGENSEQFSEFLRAEIERYEKVARAANIPKQ